MADLIYACNKTGFVVAHAAACQAVARQMDSIIIFRAPGELAQGLIEEHYAMKGFRIDTKSCTWGPMSGFVCVDPRLTKDASYEAKNENWTAEAVSGHITEKFFGDVTDASWVADVMPIVISQQRIDYLRGKGLIAPRIEGKDLVGESKAPNGGTVLYWRLVPVGNATNDWLNVAGTNPSSHFVLCVNTRGAAPFKQQYPGGISAIPFRGHETILGLINPGTKDRGFKACVTADYDLFSIWPSAATGTGTLVHGVSLGGGGNPASTRHALNASLLNKFPAPSTAARLGNGAISKASALPGGVARMPGVDDRLQAAGHREHHRFGDVSARVMLIKTMLNSALIGAGGYQGGNAVHHNDEAGNFALAKGSLFDCLPLIAFTPKPAYGTILIESLNDFEELVLIARKHPELKGDPGPYEVRVKPDWLRQAGIAS